MNKTEISSPHVLEGLIAGSAAGGLCIALFIYLAAIVHAGLGFLLIGLLAAIYVFVIASVAWMLGLIVFGLIPWLVLHQIGFRNWIAASAAGFAVPFVVVLSCSLGSYVGTTPTFWWAAIELAVMFGAAGVVVALAVWLTAYRPWLRGGVKSPPAYTP